VTIAFDQIRIHNDKNPDLNMIKEKLQNEKKYKIGINEIN